MLVALTSDNKRKISYKTSINEGPFFCPCCGAEVGLKKGDVKIHHFYHLIDNPKCLNKNESDTHLQVKAEMYERFIQFRNCTDVELEKIFKDVRSDIFLYIDDTPVTIEIQASSIRSDVIKKRMEKYSNMGINVLWVLPEMETFKKNPFDQDDFHNLKDWEHVLYELYGERLYYWIAGSTVDAVHFEMDTIWHDGGDYGISYPREAKRRCSPAYFRKHLDIESDFTYTTNTPCTVRTSYGRVELPKYRIFKDVYEDWW